MCMCVYVCVCLLYVWCVCACVICVWYMLLCVCPYRARCITHTCRVPTLPLSAVCLGQYVSSSNTVRG